MSQEWYVKHNGKTFGPITSAKLKQLVGAAKIKAATEVRLGKEGHWIEASRVKGLLPQRTSPQQQPSHQQAGPTDLKPSQPNDSRGMKRAQEKGASPYQPPAPTEETQPARPVANTQGLQMTRAGVFTVYYGICAVLFAIGVGSLLAILGASMNIAVALILAGAIALVAGLGGYLAILVGQILCLTVPRESGGKGHAQIAVAMEVLSILLAIGGGVMAAILEASGSDTVLLESVLNFVISAMAMVGYICFLYFVKNLALYINRNDLASSSAKVVRMVVVVAVMLLLFPVMESFVSGVNSMIVFLAVSLIVVVAFLITFIRYANLVGYLARAIPK